MAWYVSYRTGGSIVMHIFKGKELAVDAACELLNRGYSDAQETYSKSRTSGRSGITRLEHPPLNRLLCHDLRPDA
jgi:hypothetical protein